jgi:aerobic carbon-monoxide dehydrogenase small subunit
MTRVALTVNGKPVEADVAPRTHLADFLREQLLLTGTHIGCEHGICGACTVEIDGEIARSCITYAVTCDGAWVRTIEGFDDDPLMARLRQAFSAAHALQCGYCTPGMLIAARDLVRRKGRISRADIRTEMSGNLCRCTGYMGLVDAIERVMASSPSPRPSRHAEGVLSARREGRGEGRPQSPEQGSAPHPNPLPTEEWGEGTRAAVAASSWLGPAPGPVASTARASPPAIVSPAAAPAQTSRPFAARGRTPIRVSVGQLEEVAGATRVSQSFVLPYPRDAVWSLMSDVVAVARCMPGLSLAGPPQGDRVAGRLEARIGPISASFAGEGTIRQFPAEYSQTVEGRGGDRKSGSRASGSVDYRLSAVADEAGREATRVDVTISYVLTGTLAQIGRGGLVRDLVRRIGEAFAQNLDAQLRDPATPMPQARLGGLTLLLNVIVDRVRTALARVLGRRR